MKHLTANLQQIYACAVAITHQFTKMDQAKTADIMITELNNLSASGYDEERCTWVDSSTNLPLMDLYTYHLMRYG